MRRMGQEKNAQVELRSGGMGQQMKVLLMSEET